MWNFHVTDINMIYLSKGELKQENRSTAHSDGLFMPESVVKGQQFVVYCFVGQFLAN